MQPSPPPPPPRPRRTLRIVLIIVGIVLVVCCGGGGVGVYFLVKGVSKATAPARAAVDSFVTDLEQGNTSGAYALLCADARQQFTQDQFNQAVAAQPVKSHSISGVNVLNSNGHVSANVTAQLTSDAGATQTRVIPVVKEGDAWKVCGHPY
jgi:hypothetical protein